MPRRAHVARIAAGLLALVVGAGPRPAEGGPADAAGTVEATWKVAGETGNGVIVGTTRVDGVAVATSVELARIVTLGAPGGVLLPDVATILRATWKASATTERPGLTWTTGASGAFRVKGLPPGVYVVRARRLGANGLEAVATIGGTRGAASADLDAPKGDAVLAGRVVGRDGKPRRAVVLVHFGDPRRLAIRRNTTPVAVGDDGRFRIAGLPRGDVGLDVRDPADGSVRTMPIALPRKQELEVATGPRMTITGRVVDADGQPVAGATLRVLQELAAPVAAAAATTEYAETTTRDDGTFAWACPFEPRRIVASAPGRGFATADRDTDADRARDRRMRELLDGDDEEEDPPETAAGRGPRAPAEDRPWSEALELRLTRFGRIEGRALDGTTPAGGAFALAIPMRPGLSAHDLANSGIPNASVKADGTFVIDDVVPGAYAVAAGGAGWTATTIAGLEEQPQKLLARRGVDVRAGATTRVELGVAPSATIEGVVKGPDRRPIADAVVVAALPAGAGLPLGGGRLPQFDIAGGAVSGPDGRYVLDDVPPDVRVRVAATAGGRLVGFSEAMAVPSRAKRRADVALRATGSLDVRVVLAGSDQPVRGALVVAEGTDDAALHPGAASLARTDDDGRAVLRPLSPEVFVVKALDAERLVSVDQTIDPNEPASGRRGVVLRLPARGRVSGKLVGPAGVPVATARIEFEPPGDTEEERGLSLDFGRDVRTQRVEPSGAFFAECDRGGPLRVRATLCWDGEFFEAAQTVTAPAEGLVLTLTRFRPADDDPRLLVRVLDPAGKPVPKASWRLVGITEGARAVPVELSGRDQSPVRAGVAVFDPRKDELRSLGRVASAYFVDVFRARDEKGPLPLGFVRVGPLPARGGVREVRMPAERALTARVVGADRKGVAGVRLTARFAPLANEGAATFLVRRRSLASAETDANGTAVLRGIGVGPFVVDVDPADAYVVPAPVAVADGAASIEVSLVAARQAVVTVLDGDKRPVAGAEVAVYPHLPKTAVPDVPADARSKERLRSELERLAGESARLYRPGVAVVTRGSTDADGRFRAVRLDAGVAYDLVVTPPHDRPDLSARELMEWPVADTPVSLAGTGDGLRVKVRGADGKPVEACTLFTGDGQGWRDAHATRMADGAFFLRRLGRGAVNVVATRPGRAAPVTTAAKRAWARRAATVLPGARDIDVVVDDGVPLVLRVSGVGAGIAVVATVAPDTLAGTPPEPATRFGRLPSLSSLLGARDEPATYTARDGVLTVPGLDADDRFVVHAWSDDQKAAVVRGVAPGSTPTEIVLRPVAPVGGRVVPAPAEGEEAVVAYATPGLTGQAPVEADGRFGVGGLPPGSWRLRVTVKRGIRTVRDRVFRVETSGETDVGDVELVEGSLDDALDVAFGAFRKPRDADPAALDRVLRFDPEEPNALFARAELRKAANNAAGASEDLDRLIAAWPGHAKARALRGEARWEKMDFGGALDDFERSVASDDDPYQRFLLAWSYLRVGNLKKAKEHAALVTDASTAARARAVLIDATRMGGDFDAAWKDAEAALAQFPTQPDIQAAWARAARRTGRAAEAVKRLREWVGAARDDERAFDELRFQRILARLESGDFATAAGELSSIDDPSGWYAAFRWVAEARAGDVKTASAHALERLAKSPPAWIDSAARRVLEHALGTRTSAEVVGPSADTTSKGEIGAWRTAGLRSQAWFFVAERRRADGDRLGAIAAYRECLATGVETLVSGLAAAGLEALSAAPAADPPKPK